MVYKKDNAPCEDELMARRSGDDWNDHMAKEYARKRAESKLIEADKLIETKEVIPTSNYKTKYAHLIGEDAALEAARKTESNKSYGFGKNLSNFKNIKFYINYQNSNFIVPSENKKDIRSIEQTMADIQAKKKLKVSHDSDTSIIDVHKEIVPESSNNVKE